MESAEIHRLYGEALLGDGAKKEATYEFESAVASNGSPAELEAAHLRLAELLESAGDRAAAAAHRKAAADLGKQLRTGPI